MSRFLQDSNFHDEPHGLIDFDDAIRLPEGGSTCDIYKTRWLRREVFVKRLKKEFRTNPIYLDALDKEYEIGINLKHPSLPDYRAFHRDYIVIDYIDGDTLAFMINRSDPWLRNEKNIVRMLREIVNATDYLHRHHVTHCDIKPDNIMITSNNHNVVLIDFEKSYTDALNDTSGDPSKYGLTVEDQGRTAIDFHGIGRTVDIIKEKVPGFRFRKYREFIKACQDNDCTADKLLEILDYKTSSYTSFYKMVLTGIPFLIGIGVIAFRVFYDGNKDTNNLEDSVASVEKPLTTHNDMMVVPAEVSEQQSQKKETQIEIQKEPQNEMLKEPQNEISAAPVIGITQEEHHALAKVRAEQFDKMVQHFYDELQVRLDSLVAFSEQPNITGGQLLERIRQHGDKEEEYFIETLAILDETFPNMTERETWRVLAYSNAYTGYKRRSSPILRELGHKVEELGDYEYLLK